MDRAYRDARTSAGAAADHRDGDPLDPRRQPRAARARMWRACSASMSRPNCRTGAPGTTTAMRVADLMIETVERYAPGFNASVVGRQVLSPLDLERVFGLTRRRYLSRRAVARPVVLGAPDARLRRLSRADRRALSLRIGRSSRRRRHRRARPQCRARHHRRSALAASAPLPTFVIHRSNLRHELRSKGALASL